MGGGAAGAKRDFTADFWPQAPAEPVLGAGAAGPAGASCFVASALRRKEKMSGGTGKKRRRRRRAMIGAQSKEDTEQKGGSGG